MLSESYERVLRRYNSLILLTRLPKCRWLALEASLECAERGRLALFLARPLQHPFQPRALTVMLIRLPPCIPSPSPKPLLKAAASRAKERAPVAKACARKGIASPYARISSSSDIANVTEPGKHLRACSAWSRSSLAAFFAEKSDSNRERRDDSCCFLQSTTTAPQSHTHVYIQEFASDLSREAPLFLQRRGGCSPSARSRAHNELAPVAGFKVTLRRSRTSLILATHPHSPLYPSRPAKGGSTRRENEGPLGVVEKACSTGQRERASRQRFLKFPSPLGAAKYRPPSLTASERTADKVELLPLKLSQGSGR